LFSCHLHTQALAALISTNSTLTDVDVSGNGQLFTHEAAAGSPAGAAVLAALRVSGASSAVVELNLQRCKVEEAVGKAVATLLFSRRAAAQQRARKALQAGWDELQ